MDVLTILGGPLGWLKKSLVVVVASALIFGAGYYKGSAYQKTKTIVKQAEHTRLQSTYVVRYGAPAEQKQLSKNKDNHDKVIGQIEATTDANPVCDWGPDDIGMFNTQRGLLP